ncbi:MAG: hypothetical protein ACLP9L_19300 [Thermoguttaceae bacterium]
MNTTTFRRIEQLAGQSAAWDNEQMEGNAMPPIKRGDPLLLVLGDWIHVIVPVVAENREKYATVPIRHVGGTRAVVSTRKVMRGNEN